MRGAPWRSDEPVSSSRGRSSSRRCKRITSCPRRTARLRHFVRRVPGRARAHGHDVNIFTSWLRPRREVIAGGFATRLKYDAIARPGQSTSRGTRRANENRVGWELPVFLRLLIILCDAVAVVLEVAILLREVLLRDVVAEIFVLLIGHRVPLFICRCYSRRLRRDSRHTTGTLLAQSHSSLICPGIPSCHSAAKWREGSAASQPGGPTRQAIHRARHLGTCRLADQSRGVAQVRATRPRRPAIRSPRRAGTRPDAIATFSCKSYG